MKHGLKAESEGEFAARKDEKFSGLTVLLLGNHFSFQPKPPACARHANHNGAPM
jgi:hypothetical protein